MKQLIALLTGLLLASASAQGLSLIYVPYAGTNHHTGLETWPPFLSEGYTVGMTTLELEWPGWQAWRAFDADMHTLEQAVTNKQPHSANLDTWAGYTPGGFQLHAANLDDWSTVPTNTVQAHNGTLDLLSTNGAGSALQLTASTTTNLLRWATNDPSTYTAGGGGGLFTNASYTTIDGVDVFAYAFDYTNTDHLSKPGVLVLQNSGVDGVRLWADGTVWAASSVVTTDGTHTTTMSASGQTQMVDSGTGHTWTLGSDGSGAFTSLNIAGGGATVDTSGNLSVGGSATVSGLANLNGAVNVAGAAVFSSTVSVGSGQATLGDVVVYGSADAPSNTNAVGWIKVVVGGTEYRMPLMAYP